MSTATPELRQIDPRTVTIGTNVRSLPELDDPEFVASVRELGVLTPITVNETAEGYELRYGQRRLLAAIAAERETVPALVLPAGDDTDEAKAARLVEQWAENEHRAAITETDRVNAVEQLALLGVPAGQIAARLHVKRSAVTAARKVASNDEAQAAMVEHDLTIEDAAILAEFADDEAAMDELRNTLSYGRSLTHTAQRLRDDRREAKALAKFRAEIEAQGIKVVEHDELTRLVNLVTAERQDITDEDHAACPGHAAYVSTSTSWDTGRPVRTPRVIYGCTDPEAHGHQHRYPQTNRSAADRGIGPDGKMTEEAKAERRKVIANNKAFESALTVRTEWIAAFAKGTGPIKGAEVFIARALIAGEAGRGYRRAEVEQLNKKLTDRSKPATALRAAVAAVLDLWNRDSQRKDGWRDPGDQTIRFLTAMQGWGYELADVEREMLHPQQTEEEPTPEDDSPEGDDE